MSVNENDWLLCSSQKILRLKATEMIANYANNAIRTKGYFSLVLAGGNTPNKIYESLSKKIVIGVIGIFILEMKDAYLLTIKIETV